MNSLSIFMHTVEVTLPVFVMVFIGIVVRRIGWIDSRFITSASTLVFRGSMPTLIFFSIVQADLDVALNPKLMGYFALATVASFALSWLWATWRVPHNDRGVYVQGAFRANCGIVGMALAASMYGNYGLSAGGLLLGVVILSYNILSVVVLSAYQQENRASWSGVLKHIGQNPLILAVLLAVPVALSGVELPGWVTTTGDYFASLTLPLALLCIGGTLSVSALRRDKATAVSASLLKMITLPLLSTAGAWAVGFRGPELGLLFLFFASPTAAASFVMVTALGGNAKLAANIIAITTLMASITVTLGVFGLRMAGVL